MMKASPLLRFLIAAAARGERTALVTITRVIGRSSRDAGTHMAISETGAFMGSLSGGCIEAAVVGEALRIIRQRRAELVRFGVGSPFLDIRLPCGGGIDLLIIPNPSLAVMHAAEQRLAARLPATLALNSTGDMALIDEIYVANAWDGSTFIVTHKPDLRLFIVGHGAETEALSRIGSAYGADVRVLSPDLAIVDRVRTQGIEAWLLKTPSPSQHLRTDMYSAVVLLFHDHGWETHLLAQCLVQEALFIGAMGSRSTHTQRLKALTNMGIAASALSRIVGPVGLIPATRDPDTLALSILAQVAVHYDAVEASGQH